ncbi:putative Non-classical export protein 2 [Sclerotinia borealis F-4128]|uniref:Putative Non-classical export protein 2 n=1 Tax=Sclerotinia borealis (strain F-4128) TaxID=1432307 RepID=W9CM40_SCLBF|nr:putative Non-classical export protein 2 [Sclerotinia borealis F-4128]
MVSVPQLLVRALQAVVMLITLALIGNAIDVQHFGNSSVNYCMFAAVFAWIVIFFGFAASFLESLAKPLILAPMDGLAALFTLIAGIVLAAKLGVHSCGNRDYINSNSLTQGSSHRCRELQAACAFFWFAFVCFVGSLILDFMGCSSTSMRRSSVRKSGPTMSQV